MSETEPSAGHPDTLMIEIDPPLSYKGGTFSVLPLREPRVGEVRKAEGQLRSGINAESMRNYSINLVASVSNWPVLVVEMLPISKLNEASEYLAGFTSRGLGTG